MCDGVEQDGRPVEDTWRWRRRFMLSTVVFCMGVIVYILVGRIDTSPADTAMTMAFFVLASTVSSYVFGAAWEQTKRIGK